jgi:hypothetical protein
LDTFTARSPLSLGPVPVAVYAAMLGATIAGQLVGISADALALGRRVMWVPLACSIVLEALVGARFGAARLGRRLKAGECARVSAYYSACLAALSLPLAAWTVASNRGLGGGSSSHDAARALGTALVALAAATVVRYALMTLVSTARRRS